jgi:hypothetical protein
MNLLGAFNLVNSADEPVPSSIRWVAEVADWKFAKRWAREQVDENDQQIRDSIDYAQTGSKRWQWLRSEGACVASAADAAKRIKKNAETEFAFAFLLSAQRTDKEEVIGFCYARRLWLGTVCLEFLGTNDPCGLSGIGSLLLYAVAETARQFKAIEIWGECTHGSQGFYRKMKTKLLYGELTDALKAGNSNPKYPRDWQLPGAVDDRFVFGRQEIILMSKLFRAKKSH